LILWLLRASWLVEELTVDRRKREEGRRKKEEGRGKKEEGRGRIAQFPMTIPNDNSQ
jgi:hypothetical protein